MTGKLEVEREENGLHIRQDRGKCEQPHFYEVRYKAIVRGAAEGLVEGSEACVEQVSEVFDDDLRRSFADAVLKVGAKLVSVKN